jgi:glycosyltransferase involved in cell wall biosynthesis
VRPDGPGLLCVVNFPANTGFAWDFIEGLYAAVARQGQALGWRTFVAYPRIDLPPRTLEGSPAVPVALQAHPVGAGEALALWRFLRANRITTVYLTDRPVRSPVHLLMRLAGVRHIVVHDHTSGHRTIPTGIRRLTKQLLSVVPGLEADRVLTVSDYVARRQVEVGLMPPARVTRIWNGVPLPAAPAAGVADLRRSLDLPADRPIIACCCRAAPEKGVHHLLRAFATARRAESGGRPLLVYVGDGPELDRLRNLAAELDMDDDTRFVGYSREVARYLQASDIVAVPSVWQDALPLGVLEAMAVGKPVVATRVGGIPEMCRDGVEGLLVQPAAVEELAHAITRLLESPSMRSAMGQRGRQRVAEFFSPVKQVAAIVEHLGLRDADQVAGAAPRPTSSRR